MQRRVYTLFLKKQVNGRSLNNIGKNCFFLKAFKYGAVLGGLAAGVYEAKNYWYSDPDAVDFSDLFAKNPKVQGLLLDYQKNKQTSSVNKGNINLLFKEVEKYLNNPNAQTQEKEEDDSDKGLLERSRENIEKAYEKYRLTGAGYKEENIVKIAENLKDLSTALEYFSSGGDASVHDRIADYISAHEAAKSAMSIFNLMPSIGSLTYAIMQQIVGGNFDQAMSDSIT